MMGMGTTQFAAKVFDRKSIDNQSIQDLAALGSDKWTRYPGAIGAFIAEMDYGIAPCIRDAMVKATVNGALGYIPDPWKNRIADSCSRWQRNNFGWNVDPKCIRPVPDVLEAYEIFLREFVGAGNSVVVPTPAYMPFLSVPRLYGVDLIEIPMINSDGGWLFDFESIEGAFAKGCHAFVLCNPHNPIGKVLTRDELMTISDLADRYDVRIFSDEIHASFVYGDCKHIPFASMGRKQELQAITATSASKSFNIAGTKCAQVILTNPDDMTVWLDKAEWSEHQTATIGAVATTAAYMDGDSWLRNVQGYLQRNLDLLNSQMAERFSKVGYVPPQGTFIAWLDFRPLGIDDPAEYFLRRANVALTDGTACGVVGSGCVRMNFAMPYPLLCECLDRMYAPLHADGLI